MKPIHSIPRVYDLAAMRGWRTIRLDRSASLKEQQTKSYPEEAREWPKAA